MIISINGSILSEQEAVIPATDHGFLYGMGLFETFRTYNGRPFLLEEHMARLESGCEELGIRWRRPSHEQAVLHIQRMLECAGIADGYVRWSVSAGTAPLGLPLEEYAEPLDIVYVKPLPAPSEGLYRHGRALQKLRLTRSGLETGTFRLKSFHYMNNIMGKRELASYEWLAGAEGLFLTPEGWLCEGLVSNLFFVKEGTLCTPHLDTGALPGITRAFVLQLAEQARLACSEHFYTWDELMLADEVFVTNSVQEIVPITTLLDETGLQKRISAEAGPITRQLIDLYRKFT
ncbi:aminotransferase class IV [Paenibacillus turpanensis]|uniref:aminotransferase class IV n=1 Tax=Paenibacillus turpanensis TaxID=2689078 RepID=UPI001408CF8A|nr:aminotransferase class IV [Paenibacillus turpanensis]